MSSPTQRSLAYLREQGYLAEVVEKWVPQARIRKDLWGFVDIVAVRDGETLGVQATDRTSVSKRMAKIAEHENVGMVRKAGWRIEVHGWGKNAAGRWTLRVEDVS